jgi:CheY-like chemotaxis protein/transcriptional regulator with GAF, ATPase, and Fis domain
MVVGIILTVEVVAMIVLLWVARRISSRRVVRAGQFAILADLSQRGFGSDSLSDLFDLVVSSVGRSLGVELVELLELQGKEGRLALRAGRGFRDGGIESEVSDLTHSWRVGQALETGKPVIMRPGARERGLYRDPWLLENGVRSGITVPIPGRGSGFGTLGAHTRKKRRFRPEDTQFLEATASVLAIAIEGRQTEQEARANQRNLAFLNEASGRLATALDRGAVLETLSSVVLPFLGDFLLVDLRGEDGRLQRLVATCGDAQSSPREADQGRTPLLRQVPATDDRADVPRARHTSEATDEELQRVAADPEQLELLRGADLSSVMVVPLSAPSRVLGSICLGGRSSRTPYGPAEFALASDLARRVALALDKTSAQRERALDKTPVQRERAELDPRKGEFRAMLSRELRDSIAALSNAIEVLRLADGEGADSRAIERAAGQVRSMNRLVADLIDVSTHGQETIGLHREPLELGALAQRAIESGRWSPGLRPQEVELVLPEAPLWVDADPVRLEQIVATLIDRVRSGGAERMIRVRVEAPEEKWGIIRILREDVASPTRPRNPPLEPASAEPVGLAIDLYLVQCLVKLHGGELSVHPAGARSPRDFIVRLPRIPVPARNPKRDAGDAEEKGGVRVLLVDDHEELATGLAELLERWGHEARVAFDGPSGLEAARGFQPDLVLLDLGLPGMDGYEVAQALRREPSLSSVEVAALTGYGHADDRRRARESGIDHYFTKPVDLAGLRRLLERRAGKSHRSRLDLG